MIDIAQDKYDDYKYKQCMGHYDPQAIFNISDCSIRSYAFRSGIIPMEALTLEGLELCYENYTGSTVWCNNVSELFAKGFREGRP